jgi:outer membrane lipoprotein SlyB
MASLSTQTVLSVLAMIALGVLGGLLVYHAVPQANVQLLTFILGAIAGAVTGGAAVKAAGAANGASDAA